MRIVFVLLALASHPCLFAQEASKLKVSGFQGVEFGSTISTIKKKFPRGSEQKLGPANAYALENFEVAGSKAGLYFLLNNGQLAAVNVLFKREPFASKGEARQQFTRIMELLKEKYGEPTDLNNQPVELLGEDVTDIKIATGETIWRVRWIDDTGNMVALTLSGKSYVPQLSLIYVDKARYEAYSKDLKSTQANDL